MPPSYALLVQMSDMLEDNGTPTPCRAAQGPSRPYRRARWDGDGTPAAERAAQTACVSCPLILLCDAYATSADEWGVWGGRTRLQRQSGEYPMTMMSLLIVLEPPERMLLRA